MAIVISRDVLFVHVPKTGGSSATAYLLDVLPAPVTYVARGPLGRLSRAGANYLPGLPHRPLAAMRDLVREQGLDFADFPAVIAVVRNPYDLAVSNYSFHRRVVVPYDLIDDHNGPPPDAPAPEAATAMVAGLEPGKIARIEGIDRKRPGAFKWDIWRAAAELHRPVDMWDHDDALYVALAPPANRDGGPRGGYLSPDLAETLEFRDFMVEENRRASRPWLSRLHDFYHLDGEAPPNLRIVRFERLADGIREVLRDIGITADAEFPWLNRSSHASYSTYYDAETEALVYDQARWLFEQGFYDRLDLKATP